MSVCNQLLSKFYKYWHLFAYADCDALFTFSFLIDLIYL